MAEKLSEEQVAREIWLQYFNDYLLQQGKITEREHSKMTSLILREGKKRPQGPQKAKRRFMGYGTVIGTYLRPAEA